MKKLIHILIMIFIAGCAKSLIKVTTNNQNAVHPVFGKNSQRNFYYDFISSDSLKPVWQSDAFGSFNNSSVVANDSMIFIADLAGRLHVFNSENGKQLGVLKTKGAIFSSPIINKFRIYYPLVKDGKKLTEFIVYDYYAGKDLYIIEIEDLITNQLLYDDSGIYLFAEDGTVYKYTYEAKLIWTSETNEKMHFVPAMKANKIFTGNDNGEIIVIDSNTGKIIFRKKISNHFFSGATIDEDLCFMGDDDGNLFAINISDYKIRWKQTLEGRILMNPATDADNVYVGTMRQNYYCISKKNGNIIWKKNLKGYFNATPVVTNNHLIVPNLFKSVKIIDKTNGETENEIVFNNRVKLSPVIINNKLIIGYDEGIISAYEFVY